MHVCDEWALLHTINEGSRVIMSPFLLLTRTNMKKEWCGGGERDDGENERDIPRGRWRGWFCLERWRRAHYPSIQMLCSVYMWSSWDWSSQSCFLIILACLQKQVCVLHLWQLQDCFSFIQSRSTSASNCIRDCNWVMNDSRTFVYYSVIHE